MTLRVPCGVMTTSWDLVCESHSVMSDSLRPHGLQPASLLYQWNSPGQNTGMGSHSLLQGIVPSQGLNLGLPHWQAGSLPSEPPREAQEYWSGQPIPSPGDLLNPGIEPGSPSIQADCLPTEPPGKNWDLDLDENGIGAAAGREWILERERWEGEERKEEPMMVLSSPNHLNS